MHKPNHCHYTRAPHHSNLPIIVGTLIMTACMFAMGIVGTIIAVNALQARDVVNCMDMDHSRTYCEAKYK